MQLVERRTDLAIRRDPDVSEAESRSGLGYCMIPSERASGRAHLRRGTMEKVVPAVAFAAFVANKRVRARKCATYIGPSRKARMGLL